MINGRRMCSCKTRLPSMLMFSDSGHQTVAINVDGSSTTSTGSRTGARDHERCRGIPQSRAGSLVPCAGVCMNRVDCRFRTWCWRIMRAPWYVRLRNALPACLSHQSLAGNGDSPLVPDVNCHHSRQLINWLLRHSDCLSANISSWQLYSIVSLSPLRSLLRSSWPRRCLSTVPSQAAMLPRFN